MAPPAKRLRLIVGIWATVLAMAIVGAIWDAASAGWTSRLIGWGLMIVWCGWEVRWASRTLDRKLVTEEGRLAYRAGVEDGQIAYERRLIEAAVELRRCAEQMAEFHTIINRYVGDNEMLARQLQAFRSELLAAVESGGVLWSCPECGGGPGGVGGADCVCPGPPGETFHELGSDRVVSIEDFRRESSHDPSR